MRQQRTIGLIGGLSWESSALYYRLINEAMRSALGGHHNARSVMVTVDFAEVLAHGTAGRWDSVADILLDAAQSLRRAGADFILITANTAHAIADRVAAALDVPLLHIADATAAAIKARGMKRVALVGTRFTTAADGFYVERLSARHGITVQLPDPADCDTLHGIIVDELTLGIVRPESGQRCLAILDRLGRSGAEGVVVGCTELPLLIAEADSPIPLLDTARIHAEAAVQMALASLEAINHDGTHMKNGVVDLDHLMIHVRDSEDAGATFERMGFTATPRSVLPGMSNRLICFDSTLPDRNNFLELMALDDRTKAPPVMFGILGADERPASMVMVSHDARAAERELRMNGFEPMPAMQFKRDWVLLSGEVLSPEFVVCIPKVGTSPLCWNLCQYLNPQLYKRPDFVRHRNRAERLVAVLAVASDADAIAGHFASAWGVAPSRTSNGVLAVQPGGVALHVMAPDSFALRYPQAGTISTSGAAARLVGAVIRSRDLAVTRRCLEEGKVAFFATAEGLYVPPARAHGTLIAFEP